jgi:hypothetical protein
MLFGRNRYGGVQGATERGGGREVLPPSNTTRPVRADAYDRLKDPNLRFPPELYLNVRIL